MTLRTKLKQIGKRLKKRSKTDYPDMPTDPKDLARAMFFPNDEKLKEQRRARENERSRNRS